MASSIRISPEQVRGVASEFKRAAGESENIVAKLQSQVNTMGPEWEGMTKQKFYTDFEGWQTQMKNFIAMLNSVGTQLDAIAARFEAADRQS